MRRAVLLLTIVAALTPSLAFADDPPDDARGFSANRVYDVHDLDAVNAFNGNLTITIPIGPENHTGGVHYALGAVYNSHLWTYNLQTYGDLSYWEESPVASNAAFGWNVLIATLDSSPYSNGDFQFATSDGTIHTFSSATELRLTSYDQGTWATVETPEGLTYTFSQLIRPGSTGPYIVPNGVNYPIPGGYPFYLTSIADLFGNVVTVNYQRTSSYFEVWTVNDGQRQMVVNFKSANPPSGTALDSVLFKTGTSAFSTYTFTVNPASLPMPKGDTSGGANPPNVTAYLLNSVQLPGTSTSYAMTYDQTTRDSSGVITRLGLPTGGAITWFCDQAALPLSNGTNPRGNLDASPALQSPVVVYSRKEYDASNNELGTWTYNRVRGPLEFCSATCPGYFGNCGGQRQLTSWVTPPAPPQGSTPAVSVSYFSTYDPLYDQCPAPGWAKDEYGYPLTHYASSPVDPTDSIAPSAFLSTERRAGVNDLGVVQNWNGGGSMSTSPSGGGALKRSQYVIYETFQGTPPSQYGGNGITPLHLRDSVTFFNDDMGCGVGNDQLCFSTVRQFGWDGYHHYRQSSTSGNFPGVNYRTSFTAFNPHVPPAVWLPDLYDDQCVADEGQARTTAITGCSQLTGALLTRSNFDTLTGALTDRRVFKNGCCTLSANDLLAHYVRDSSGHGYVTSEQYFGGDQQSLDTSSAFALPASPEYRIDHFYTFTLGSLTARETTYLDPGNSNAIVSRTSTAYDTFSGLVTSHTDASNLTTSYAYDARWRLTGITRPGSNPAAFTYVDAGGGAPAKATLSRVLSSSNYVLHVFTYDDFGRLVRDESRTQTGGTSYVQTSYDVLGRTTAVSSMVDASVGTPPATTYQNFDAFDNPGTITSPDGSQVSLTRTASQATRTTDKIAGPNGSLLTSKTTETYDRFGRLRSVKEPSGPTGTVAPLTAVGDDVITTYGYDVANHLVSVSSPGSGVTQLRAFAYDGRGFLQSETHPELGVNGNGSATYGAYDSRGHATRKTTGATSDGFDLKFTFDKAERLVKLEDLAGTATPRTLKMFIYGAFGAANQGRLLTAIRHNYLSLGDVIVSESYDYDSAGRIKSRGTSTSRSDGTNTTPMQSFTQSFGYDNVDELTELDYPVPGSGPASSTITNTYSNGFLQQVASSQKTYGILTYNPNGTVATVKHGTNGGVDILDTYVEDLTNALPRPASIAFTGWQDCPSPSITVASSVCPSSTGNTASVSANGATGYTWTLSAGAITAGQSTSQITFTAPSSGPFNVSVAVTGSCAANASRSVNVSTGPTAQVSGSTTIASGGSASIHADLTGTPPWSVTWSDAVVQSPVASSPAQRTVTPSATTTYTVSSLTDASACPNGTSSGSAVITVTPAPPAAPAFISAVSQVDLNVGPAAFTKVFVSWPAVSGAASYSVERATVWNGAYGVVGSPAANSLLDQPAGVSSLPQTYVYRVWSVSSAGTRSLTSSPLTFATVSTQLFTNEPIQASVTPVRGIHIGELRRAIDEVRRAAGLPPNWSSYAALTGVPASTDVTSLRSALDWACLQIRGVACSYSGSAPATNVTIQAIHVQAIRDAVK